MSDLHTLGKAMRDAQRAHNFDNMSGPKFEAMLAAEAAFDKALSEPSAAQAEIEGLVKRLRERRDAEIIDGWERVEWEDEDALEAADELETLSAAYEREKQCYLSANERAAEIDAERAAAEARVAQLEEHASKQAQDIVTLGQLAGRAAELEAALRPFAEIAEHDVADSDSDADTFLPMHKYNRGPRLTVGLFRAARAALSTEAKAQGGDNE